jgi:uncharacterized protein YkwD
MQSLLDTEEVKFLGMINEYRRQNGRGPLTISMTLSGASQWLADDMAAKNYFSHTDSLGRNPGSRYIAFGYPSGVGWGENIAAGSSDARNTFCQWKTSAGHNANMLNGSYVALGIGRAYSSKATYRWYWVNAFGTYIDSALRPGVDYPEPPVPTLLSCP